MLQNNFLSFAIVLLAVGLPSVRPVEEALMFVIPASKLQCFFQPVELSNYTTLFFDFQVMYGGDLDVSVIVLDPSGRPVKEEHRVREGSHIISNIKLGDYQICFDNTFSYQSSKTIFFRVELIKEDGSSTEEELPHPAAENLMHLTSASHSLIERMQSIHKRLNMVTRYQAEQRVHEFRDRMLMGQKLSRVDFWSILNSSIMIIVSGMQVYIIRSFFGENAKGIRNMRQRT